MTAQTATLTDFLLARACSVEGCGRDGKLTRGMCQKHYRHWLDHTKPEDRPRPPRFERSFWDYVDKSGTCWVWNGPRNRQGYGLWSGLGSDGQRGLAHRLALQSEEPAPDSALFACHRCDNPPCVNPAHLYWGTVEDNGRDVSERGGAWNRGMRRSTCKRGHAMTGDNVRHVGGRDICRECDNMRSRERQRRYRAEGRL
jgi:hypothetical protein